MFINVQYQQQRWVRGLDQAPVWQLLTVLPTSVLAIIQSLFSLLIKWYVWELLHNNPHSNFHKFDHVLLPKPDRVSQQDIIFLLNVWARMLFKIADFMRTDFLES